MSTTHSSFNMSHLKFYHPITVSTYYITIFRTLLQHIKNSYDDKHHLIRGCYIHLQLNDIRDISLQMANCSLFPQSLSTNFYSHLCLMLIYYIHRLIQKIYLKCNDKNKRSS